jgi:hypothetical protein
MNVQYELYSVGLDWRRERYLNNSLAKVHRPFIDEAVGHHSLPSFTPSIPQRIVFDNGKKAASN